MRFMPRGGPSLRDSVVPRRAYPVLSLCPDVGLLCVLPEVGIQGYLTDKKTPPPLRGGPPYGPRHMLL